MKKRGVLKRQADGDLEFVPQSQLSDDADNEEHPMGAWDVEENTRRQGAGYILECEEHLASEDIEEAENPFEDDEQEFGPDLHEYFSRYDLSMDQRVTLCRAYANYVAKTFKK